MDVNIFHVGRGIRNKHMRDAQRRNGASVVLLLASA